MPELPEVETVVRELQASLIGKSFGQIITLRDDIREPIPDLSGLEGKRIASVSRRAKYIIIGVQGLAYGGQRNIATRHTPNAELIIHLGMSGQITIGRPQPRKKHDHVVFELSNGDEMVFNDARRFGLVTLNNPKLFSHLGPEPLSNEFNEEYLENALTRRKGPVKVALMDQELVVGVGNIYASEALFRSRINPKLPANKVKNLPMLISNIRAVLLEAIESGGSTLRDYVRSSGDLGYFQHSFAVYGRDKKPCVKCKASIEKITQAGRSTFYCPKCQK
jgi:formamidopyrimidine-DNA glycosylase